MLKSRSAKRMFENHSWFRKRYPRGGFWSGYEHHESTGIKDLNQSTAYIPDQEHHHNIDVIDDRQKKVIRLRRRAGYVNAHQGLTVSEAKGRWGS